MSMEVSADMWSHRKSWASGGRTSKGSCSPCREVGDVDDIYPGINPSEGNPYEYDPLFPRQSLSKYTSLSDWNDLDMPSALSSDVIKPEGINSWLFGGSDEDNCRDLEPSESLKIFR